MVLLEAMSRGVPGVCFDFKCGPKDIIRNGKNGMLVPEGDIPALASAMESIMRDPTLRTHLSEEALKTCFEYTEDKVMAQWANCFKSIL